MQSRIVFDRVLNASKFEICISIYKEDLMEQIQGVPPNKEELKVAFNHLCEVIARLRSPTGCPWDRQQTMKTIKPYTLEETYELLEAIDSDDNDAICEELGDVLLQVVLDSQIAADERRFTIINVINNLSEKMIRRHPHVFGDVKTDSQEVISRNWHRIKAEEKQERKSLLDGLPIDLPALAKAARLQDKAARVGYDFPHRLMLFGKLEEELAELKCELNILTDEPVMEVDINVPHVKDQPVEDSHQRLKIQEELGDLLFVIANIARRWKINPEEALEQTNRKFKRRFQAIERGLARDGKTIHDSTIIEKEEYYQQEKRREKQEGTAC
jgi:MazG family protein